MLYHVGGETEVMVGPSEGFDRMAVLQKGHTVRLTGYSPDKVWARIMLDDGAMGFVKLNALKQGVKTPIPEASRIYKE